MTEAPEAGALPALAVLEDFLNTRDERSFTIHGTRHPGGDELATPAALTSWLAGRGLIHAGTRASDADLRQAHALREAMRGALAAKAGSSWDGPATASKTMPYAGRVRSLLISRLCSACDRYWAGAGWHP